MPHIIIPLWFYGFDAIMYFIGSMVGLLLSFYFQKLYSLSSEKKHMYIFLGFLLLSFGLLALSISYAFSYSSFWQCRPSCVLGLLDETIGLESLSFFIYFGLSIIAYALFMMAYLPKKFSIPNLPTWLISLYFFIVLITLPLETGNMQLIYYSAFFNLVSFIMLIFVMFINFINFSEIRTVDSLKVTAAFLLLALFHLFQLFSFISEWLYVLAHIALLIGFLSLLSVVFRVKKK